VEADIAIDAPGGEGRDVGEVDWPILDRDEVREREGRKAKSEPLESFG
jgi:hypothetical protein